MSLFVLLLLNVTLTGKTGRKWASFSAASFPCPLGCFKCCSYWISKRTRNNRWWPQSPSENCGGNVKGYNNMFTRYNFILYLIFKMTQLFLLLPLKLNVFLSIFFSSFFLLKSRWISLFYKWTFWQEIVQKKKMKNYGIIFIIRKKDF